MITGITIENFKGIGARVTIPLKPITLLFGPNSAGKSTILHALQYAFEVLHNRNLDADHTSMGGPFVDLGGFQNFVHNHDLTQAVTFGFEMRRTDPDSFLIDQIGQWQAYEGVTGQTTQRMTDIESARVEFSIRWSSWRACAYVSSYSVWLDGKPVATIEADADKRGARLTRLNLQHPIFESKGEDSPDNDEAEVIAQIWSAAPMLIAGQEDSRALGLLEPDALPEIDVEEELIFDQIEGLDHERWGSSAGTRILAAFNLLSWMLVGPAQLLRSELRSMIYLGPLRQTPPRDFQPPKSKEPGRWATGLAAWDALKADADGLVKEVSDWISRDDRLDTGYALKVRRLRELDEESPLMIQLSSERAFDDIDDLKAELQRLPERRRLVLVEQRSNIDVDPEDVGEGIAQIVPVVVAALSPGARLIAIEQPELHVHPRVQVALGDLFIQRANEVPDHGPPPQGLNPAGTLLIETHSEHLLLRLLRRIRETAEGTLPELTEGLRPNDLAVLYVEPGEVGSVVRELRITPEGDFIDAWPDGFFDERGKELLG